MHSTIVKYSTALIVIMGLAGCDLIKPLNNSLTNTPSSVNTPQEKITIKKYSHYGKGNKRNNTRVPTASTSTSQEDIPIVNLM